MDAPRRCSGPLSSPSRFIRFGNELVFSAGSANGRAIDRELWVYDGREVRQLPEADVPTEEQHDRD